MWYMYMRWDQDLQGSIISLLQTSSLLTEAVTASDIPSKARARATTTAAPFVSSGAISSSAMKGCLLGQRMGDSGETCRILETQHH